MSKAYTRTDGSPRPWLIYLLVDPRDGEVRYVGKALEQKGCRDTYTTIAKRRLYNHVYYARKKAGNHRLHWIRSLLDAGLEPVMSVVFMGEGVGAEEAEVRWIAAGRFLGVRLTNGTMGGEGAAGRHHTDEAKAKIGAANKSKRLGCKHSEETKAKIGNAHRGRKIPLERVARTAASLKGRKLPKEQVEKTAAGNRGQRRSPEVRAKISAALLGRKLSVEHKAKISESRKQTPNSQRQADGRFGAVRCITPVK